MKHASMNQNRWQTLVPFPFTELKDPLTDLAFYDVMKPLLAFCTGIAHVSGLALRTKEADEGQVADALELLTQHLQAAGAILHRWGGDGPGMPTRDGPDPARGEEDAR